LSGKIGRLVITHKDRLLRFGAELVFSICEARNVEVLIMNPGENTTFEEDLAKDVLEIFTVFSARLYGSRSHKNKRMIDQMKKTVEDAEYPWTYEVTKYASQQPFLDLQDAFSRFFKKLGGKPKFKKRENPMILFISLGTRLNETKRRGGSRYPI